MAGASRFVGRTGALARLIELVDEHRLVTVTGTGGVGKTRLASEAVAELEERFDAGAVVAHLAFLPPGAGADDVAVAAGFESAAAAAVALVEQPTLLVLDNVEHVLDGVGALLAEVFATGAEVRVVTTSREPLGMPEERVLVLEPLGLPGPEGVDAASSPAVQLFFDRAEAVGAALPRDPRVEAAVGELCRRLDGLPLALELAAARTRSIAPFELLDLVDERLDVLRRQRPIADAHDSMRAAIDVSVSLLTADERAFFRALAVFTGAFDVALAHDVAGRADRLETLDLLTRLVDCSLVVAETRGPVTSYRLLELLRAHAREHLVASGDAASVQERFVDAMVATADRIVAQALELWGSEVLLAAAAQLPNLVQACHHCIGHDAAPDRAFRLLLPLFASANNGRAAEVASLGRAVFTRWPDDAAPWRAEALAVVAAAAALAGERGDVTTFAARALADPSASGIAVAVAERSLGLAARGRDDAGALDHLQRAAVAAGSVGFASLARETGALAAAQLDALGRADEALDALQDAELDARGAADVVVEALVHLLRATVLLRAGRLHDAGAELAAAERAATETRLTWWNAAIFRTKTALVGEAEGWPAAASVVREAVDFAASVGALGELALTLRNAAAVAGRLGHATIADTLARAAPPSTAATVLPDVFPDVPRPRHEATGSSLVDALRRARAALDEEIPADEAPTGSALRRDGDTWVVAYAGRSARLRHLKGMEAIATLVARPGHEAHCLELMGGAETGASAGPVLDDTARRRYQARLLELQADIDEAEANNDRGRAEHAEREHDALVAELTTAFGLGGRARSTGSSAERARTAVAYRIRSALKKLHDVHPELARHLSHALRTGTFCSYEPESPVEWSVDLTP